MMNEVMIFIVGVIIGIILMAIITAANNIQWKNDTDAKITVKSQEILDQLKASELGIILHPDDVDIEKVDDTTIYIKRRNRV